MPVIAAPNQLVVMFTVTPGMLDPLGNLSMGFILTLTDCVTSRAARIDNQNLKTVSVTLEAKMGKSRRVVVGQVMYGRGNTDFINDNLVMGSFFFQERNGEKLDYWTGSHTMSIVKN
ncbi:unnamed protein product, partial [Mesorhabditis spiculigera]